MLLSVILELTSQRTAVLPAHLGRANHSLLLKWISGFDAPLAQALHDGDGPRPVTCSSLLGITPTATGLPVRAGAQYSVRLTSLDALLSQKIEERLIHDAPANWNLHDHPFAVSAVVCDPARNTWSNSTSYEELAGRYLVAGEKSGKSVTIEFVSPTTFKSKEMQVPVPMPGLVFGSLLDRWNALSAVTLPDDFRLFAEEAVAISYHHLRTEVVQHKQGSLLIGAVGKVTYRALSDDIYWLACLNILADFAFYSGVGAKTSTGLGQCRRIAANNRQRD